MQITKSKYFKFVLLGIVLLLAGAIMMGVCSDGYDAYNQAKKAMDQLGSLGSIGGIGTQVYEQVLNQYQTDWIVFIVGIPALVIGILVALWFGYKVYKDTKAIQNTESAIKQ